MWVRLVEAVGLDVVEACLEPHALAPKLNAQAQPSAARRFSNVVLSAMC
jgi:hypothetical protein